MADGDRRTDVLQFGHRKPVGVLHIHAPRP